MTNLHVIQATSPLRNYIAAQEIEMNILSTEHTKLGADLQRRREGSGEERRTLRVRMLSQKLCSSPDRHCGSKSVRLEIRRIRCTCVTASLLCRDQPLRYTFGDRKDSGKCKIHSYLRSTMTVMQTGRGKATGSGQEKGKTHTDCRHINYFQI